MITRETTICRSSDIVAGDIDSEVVMMSIEKGNYYGLDPVAGRIWELLADPIHVGEMIGILRKEYDV